MRISTIILYCGLFIVAAISLVVCDVFFVRALSLLALVVLTLLGIVSTRRAINRQEVRATLLVGALILTGLAFTNAPFQWIFATYESQFEAVSDKLVAGERLNFPFWIGPFKVIDGGIRDGSGVPYLMTSGHPYEINGFVRDPKGTYFNLWSITPVSDRWAYIQED